MTTNINPLVTIGIPTYNRLDSYLKKAFSSALNQTYKNVEIIVSDNCSNDNTEAFFQSISDPHLRYFRQNQNIGPINNYNYCLEQANGDYFLLLHDDDLIDEDFVEICMEGANNAKDYGIIRAGIRLIDDRNKTLRESRNQGSNLSTEEYLKAWFMGKVAWYLPSTLFNTKMLKRIGGFDPKYQLLPDIVALVKLEAKFKRLDIEDVKASFRIHSEALTYTAKVKDWCGEYLLLSNLMCDLMPDCEALIRSEGMRFFALCSYKRAKKVKLTFKRLTANLLVFKMFSYRYLPPFIENLFFKNALFCKIRKLKNLNFLKYKD